MLSRNAIVLTSFLLIAACTVQPSTGFLVPTPTAVSLIPTNTPDNIGTVPAPTHSPEPREAYLGELYFLLSTVSPPFTYQLGYLPTHCLLITACPALEVLSGFPDHENEYSPLSGNPMSWSLDGKQALIFNPNKSQLLSFTPHNRTFQVLADDLALITDRITWSPDNQWLAVAVQTPEYYTGHIMLVNVNNGERRALNSSAGQIQYPLGWLNTKELLVLVNKYEPARNGDIQKQNISEVRMYKVNIESNLWVELGQNMSWSGNYPVLSPDKSFLAYTTNDNDYQLIIMSADGTSEKVLGSYGVMPAWSPNGDWIATILSLEDKINIYVVHPDGTEPRSVFQDRGYFATVIWLPDNEHLLVLIFKELADRDATSLFVVDVLDGSLHSVAIPGLEAMSYMINGVSLRPTGNP